MTRTQFQEGINDFSDLIDFCNEIGCDYCEDIYDDDSRDEVIEEDLADYIRENGWRDTRDWLYGIETGYDWYKRDNYGDWVGLGDADFEQYKDDVESYCMECGCFDEDDEDEDDEEEPYRESEDPEEPPIETEDCSMNDLFAGGFCSIVAMRERKAAAEHEADEAFDAMIF